jgi:methanethiol S-methyltransferase
MTTSRQSDAGTGARFALLSAFYAGVVYLGFLAMFLYTVGFVSGAAVPRTIDSGGPRSNTATAVVIDVLLLALFAVQHTAMARPAFKRRWTTIVPAHVERSTFVLAATAVLALVFWQWRPIPAVVWQVDPGAARFVLWALFAAGWALVVAMTFAIDHLDFFGLRQVGHYLRGLAQTPPAFRHPLPYRLVRHPMMVGFFPAFLAVPTMTGGHLLFALMSCGYILFGVRLEEHDLAGTHPEYRAYAAATPRFVPRPWPAATRPVRNMRFTGPLPECQSRVGRPVRGLPARGGLAAGPGSGAPGGWWPRLRRPRKRPV